MKITNIAANLHCLLIFHLTFWEYNFAKDSGKFLLNKPSCVWLYCNCCTQWDRNFS